MFCYGASEIKHLGHVTAIFGSLVDGDSTDDVVLKLYEVGAPAVDI